MERQEGDREAVFDNELWKEHEQQPANIDSPNINDQDSDYRPSSPLTKGDAKATKNSAARKATGKENDSPLFSSTAKSNNRPQSAYKAQAPGRCPSRRRDRFDKLKQPLVAKGGKEKGRKGKETSIK
ncbi:uncharacterized protein N7443_000016 [Penicillium atrosanguineum]|uniref:uncharacterized protein n=1 Tax=Penicillium atrosanguineum TaxID=1132637 RepID=UPI00239232FB|nr:uncharacterized protein N7443_000016 [Penicillium atrosanguineum]KAJ5313132.1 hypothetical protein N7443_000016 [Penicillium atrosanguineum]